MKIINCLTEDNPFIKNKNLKKVSVKEGHNIAIKLFNILDKRKDGIGLAAPQVGINAQVAVVNVIDPLILINPVIKEQWDSTTYYEGCLSYPGKRISTRRFKNIIIHTEQEECDWYFYETDEQKLLEIICVQHEIAHLQGQTMFDYEYKINSVHIKKKIGRNDICYCGSNKKYKKCCMKEDNK